MPENYNLYLYYNWIVNCNRIYSYISMESRQARFQPLLLFFVSILSNFGVKYRRCSRNIRSVLLTPHKSQHLSFLPFNTPRGQNFI